MAKPKIKGKELRALGFPSNKSVGIALGILSRYYKKSTKEKRLNLMEAVLKDPERFLEHQYLTKLAVALTTDSEKEKIKEESLILYKDFEIYGEENIETSAVNQMKVAMSLPIVAEGALMPDAHQGYGLPIGGVLATENAVIPYGVGVDIGCRMCLSIYRLPVKNLDGHKSRLKNVLVKNTRFGMGSEFKEPIDDAIFERRAFSEFKLARQLRDKAYRQIGTSGGGNHFVEFGLVEISDPNNEFGLEIGRYMGLLSHSGSRGLGAKIATYYTQLARDTCRLPRHAQHLAWLKMDQEAGQEYWNLMNLAGDYASACHHQIHKRISKELSIKPIAVVENHHNFAWKEMLSDGREVIVHRKGATPAGKGVLGVIPGSMTAPGYIVRGRGVVTSLNSASHGAGRQMSRSKARNSITKSELRDHLLEKGVTLIGGGLDEAPMAYKDIQKVMNYQTELVDIVGTFQPKIVRMDSK